MSDRLSGMLSFVFALVITARLASSVPAQEEPELLIDANTVDAWIFQGFGNPEQTRGSLNSESERQVSDLDRRFDLSDPQCDRLRLAASGDIQRFFNRVQSLRRQIASQTYQRDGFQAAYARTQVLQKELKNGLFDGDSLFFKVLTDELEPGQAEALRRVEQQSRERQIRVHVQVFVADLQLIMPMTSHQRKSLCELLVKQIGTRQLHAALGQEIVFSVVATIPEAELRKLFDGQQWGHWKSLQRESQQIRRRLIDDGVLEPPAKIDGNPDVRNRREVYR